MRVTTEVCDRQRLQSRNVITRDISKDTFVPIARGVGMYIAVSFNVFVLPLVHPTIDQPIELKWHMQNVLGFGRHWLGAICIMEFLQGIDDRIF